LEVQVTQRLVFSKEAIVEAAFRLTREKGWEAVTARTIARRLNSSTMPIYSSLKSMEEIEREVRAKAEALMLEYQRRAFTDNPLVNMAVGYVTFAKDEPGLFRFLYTDRPLPSSKAAREQGRARTLPDISREGVALADQASVSMQDARVLKSWIFTHGLASMISAGVLDLSPERIQSLLMEAGVAFYSSNPMHSRAGKPRGGNTR
jgi:AcrR family transcriptional regulator